MEQNDIKWEVNLNDNIKCENDRMTLKYTQYSHDGMCTYLLF